MSVLIDSSDFIYAVSGNIYELNGKQFVSMLMVDWSLVMIGSFSCRAREKNEVICVPIREALWANATQGHIEGIGVTGR